MSFADASWSAATAQQRHVSASIVTAAAEQNPVAGQVLCWASPSPGCLVMGVEGRKTPCKLQGP